MKDLLDYLCPAALLFFGFLFACYGVAALILCTIATFMGEPFEYGMLGSAGVAVLGCALIAKWYYWED